jgi:hypothetical protein
VKYDVRNLGIFYVTAQIGASFPKYLYASMKTLKQPIMEKRMSAATTTKEGARPMRSGRDDSENAFDKKIEANVTEFANGKCFR